MRLLFVSVALLALVLITCEAGKIGNQFKAAANPERPNSQHHMRRNQANHAHSKRNHDLPTLEEYIAKRRESMQQGNQHHVLSDEEIEQIRQRRRQATLRAAGQLREHHSRNKNKKNRGHDDN